MRYAMAHTQNEWRINRCYKQAEKKKEKNTEPKNDKRTTLHENKRGTN